RRAAVEAAGALDHERLWPYVVKSLAQPSTTQTAVAALARGGQHFLPAMAAAWQDAAAKPVALPLARARARIRTPGAATLLAGKMASPDVEIRNDVLYALQRCGYRADAADVATIRAAIIEEGRGAAWTSAALIDLAGDEALGLLRAALELELAAACARV